MDLSLFRTDEEKEYVNNNEVAGSYDVACKK